MKLFHGYDIVPCQKGSIFVDKWFTRCADHAFIKSTTPYPVLIYSASSYKPADVVVFLVEIPLNLCTLLALSWTEKHRQFVELPHCVPLMEQVSSAICSGCTHANQGYPWTFPHGPLDPLSITELCVPRDRSRFSVSRVRTATDGEA